ncbi:MAG TPA: tRNA (adenosine(37)-N6)-threonylcarbamoyltransferase complex dimerization subunit type 1 TsaB [Candidatus Limnocylindrales bacterium]|nr:tRNA (adenosine(37)-N6)-threonylcarbamoyltransferase complex dimerization subunit type 1 TsaB [Candidatus Limnocylindrales bacterium]
MTAGGPLLVLDTATREAVVGVAEPGGTLVALERWTAGYRHGEELLARVEAALAAAGTTLAGLGGIVVGTGPGAFTGLRVGIATAKGLAHAASLPIAGVSTGEALLRAAAAEAGGEAPAAEAGGEAPAADADRAALVLLLPAGPSDRVVCRPGTPPALLPGGDEPDLRPGELVLALDLDGRAPADALRRGAAARDGLARALAALGVERLRAGGDDLARLVPEYVTLPRGVRSDVPEAAVHVARGG